MRADIKMLLQKYKISLSTRRAELLLIAIVMAYIFFLSLFTIERYNSFLTNALDLGIFNQAFWTTLHGKLFYATPDLPVIPSGSFLGTHFAPIMFLLLPIYAIHPYPETLLVMQTVFIALSAIPIYLISFEVLKSKGKALAFACLFLSYPVVHSLNIYDFHLEAFLPFFLLSSYYCYLKEKWITYWIFIVLSLITIDFAAVLIAAMSLTNLLSKLRIRGVGRGKLSIKEKSALVALVTLVVSAISFFLILQASIFFSGKTSDVGNVLSGFLTPARRGGFSERYIYIIQFWLYLISNLLFLPFFAPSLLLMTGPWFLITLLNPGAATYHILGYQYGGAFVAPFIFIASIYGAKRLLHDRRSWCLAFVVMLSFSALMTPLNPLTENKISGIAYEGYPGRTAHTESLTQVLALIPPNASVYTVNNLFPQLSNRDNAYVHLPSNVDFEYVLADQTAYWYIHKIHGSPSMSENLPKFMVSEDYGIVAYIDGVILLKRGYDGDVLLSKKVVYVYNYRNLSLWYGSQIYDHTSVSVNVLMHRLNDSIGTFWFGPYSSLLPGNYTATFRLKAENVTAEHLLSLRVTRKLGSVVLASYEVNGSDFEREGFWQNFTLSFSISQEVTRNLTDPQENLEFVGIARSSNSVLYLDYIEITSHRDDEG
jgi:uncharacterized membrane protein